MLLLGYCYELLYFSLVDVTRSYLLTVSRPSRLLILDEMDQLDSKMQHVLYTLFEWPFLPNSRLWLIGKVATTFRGQWSENCSWSSNVTVVSRRQESQTLWT